MRKTPSAFRFEPVASYYMVSELIFTTRASDLVAYDEWLNQLSITQATGWRWRKRGWIPTVNICGRVYVSRSAIAEFERRAAADEFAKEHVTPKRSGSR
jgi:hypothetical protein